MTVQQAFNANCSRIDRRLLKISEPRMGMQKNRARAGHCNLNQRELDIPTIRNSKAKQPWIIKCPSMVLGCIASPVGVTRRWERTEDHTNLHNHHSSLPPKTEGKYA